MRVDSLVTNGARRMKAHTPELSFVGTGVGIQHNEEHVIHYWKKVSHKDGRTYILELTQADIEVVLAELARFEGGRKMMLDSMRSGQ